LFGILRPKSACLVLGALVPCEVFQEDILNINSLPPVVERCHLPLLPLILLRSRGGLCRRVATTAAVVAMVTPAAYKADKCALKGLYENKLSLSIAV